MLESSLIEFGSHTLTHPRLTDIAIDEAEKEIFESKKRIEEILNIRVDSFCYPNGYYNDKIKELADKSANLEYLTKSFNDKFGEKDEEDLSDAEAAEMEKILKQIEAEQKAIEKIQVEQQQALEKFNALIEQTKERLGI